MIIFKTTDKVVSKNSLVNKFFAGGMILALILFAIVMIERAVGNFF